MSKVIFNHPFMLGFEQFEEVLDRCVKSSEGYPPYNIEQVGESTLLIKIAVAGFLEEELQVIQENNQLIISSNKNPDKDNGVIYIHKGISFRKFKKAFVLAGGVEPVRSYLENGILIVELKKEKPKKNVKVIGISSK